MAIPNFMKYAPLFTALACGGGSSHSYVPPDPAPQVRVECNGDQHRWFVDQGRTRDLNENGVPDLDDVAEGLEGSCIRAGGVGDCNIYPTASQWRESLINNANVTVKVEYDSSSLKATFTLSDGRDSKAEKILRPHFDNDIIPSIENYCTKSE